MHYIIKPSNKYNNSIEISLNIPQQYLSQNGIKLYMPRHISGSYMMRDFAKHITNITAENNIGNKIFIHKIGISEWYLDKYEHDINLTYTLFATDKSVRGNYADDERILINGAAAFIYAEQFQHQKLTLDIQIDDEYKIFTTLTQNSQYKNQFIATDFEELCDTPILILKNNTYISNEECKNKDYKIVFSGDIPHNLNIQKINDDINTICTAQDKFFDCENEYKTHLIDTNIDYKYLFMTHIAQDSYGGLEHKASTVLACSPENLYINNQKELNSKYIEFLGLCSHEYFHSWWVKRVKPQAFIKANLQQEFDTSLLWVFEGFTSYYDDLFLYKTNIINKEQYIKLIEKNINNIYKNNGHYEQNLYESSVDAWIKYYQPNENSHNVNISYYTKGSLIALCLDLYLRINTQNKLSLDTIMLFIFNKYGRDFYTKNIENRSGITYESLIQDIETCTKINIKNLLDSWIFNTDIDKDLPFIEYLQHFGINCSKNIEYTCDWGIQYNKNNTFIIIDKVNSHGLAYKAKLMAGDILVSINNTSILAKDANEIFDRINKDEPMLFQYIRNRQLKQIVIKYEDMQQEKFILNIEKDYNMENIWPC